MWWLSVGSVIVEVVWGWVWCVVVGFLVEGVCDVLFEGVVFYFEINGVLVVVDLV